MRPKPVIALTVKVEAVAHLFNYLIQDESVNAPTHYLQSRLLYRRVQEWLEARSLIDSSPIEDIDSNALFLVDNAVVKIVEELNELLGGNTYEFLAVVPFDSQGGAVVVLALL